jgi:hypothetical protein
MDVSFYGGLSTIAPGRRDPPICRANKKKQGGSGRPGTILSPISRSETLKPDKSVLKLP